MQVTILQAAMIKKIAYDECTPCNGARPEDHYETLTWSGNIIETAQDKGVFTSLMNADLVYHDGADGPDAAVRLTAKGFEVFETL